MASLLDISLVGYFSNIFVILFIFAAAYAVLMFKKPLGDNKGINALLALTTSIIFILYQPAIDIIKETVPWFIIMMIALVFVVIVTQSIGAQIPTTVMASIGTWVLVLSIIILVINISLKLGQNVGPFLNSSDTNTVEPGSPTNVGSGSFAQNFGATLFHPKVLALLLVLIIAVFAVLWIGYSVV